MDKLGQIRIHTTYARVAVERTDSTPVIHRVKEQFSQPVRPEVRLESELPTVTIDSTETRAAMGILTQESLRLSRLQIDREAALVGIDRVVQEGHSLADIENKDALVAELARSNSMAVPQASLEYVSLPLPEVQITPRQVEIGYELAGGVSPLYQYKPFTRWTPPQFDVWLDPPGLVDIDFVNAPAVIGGGTEGSGGKFDATA